MTFTNIFTGKEIEPQWFIDTLKEILAKIFAFVATEEGWEACAYHHG